ncbi:MAG: sigma-70 family RNA polymerase sigma factor [Bacteroidota bacterium]
MKPHGENTGPLSTERLIAQCREQDPVAQKALYERFARPMAMICHRYVTDHRDAEEVLFNGFLKVFRKLDAFEYRGEDSLRAWIKRIMINEALMRLRKQQLLWAVGEEHLPGSEVVAAVEHSLAAEDLYRLILRLPSGYRTVFNLYAIEGYSHAEIAEALGITVNTSKSQLSKARAWLRQRLETED